MPVVSRYCNICNRLITAREIESGEAIVYQTYYYCPKCKQEAMPIIEAIRRRQEREKGKEEEEQAAQKKSSTRFGSSPVGKKHRASPTAHKLRKPRGPAAQSHRPGARHRPPTETVQKQQAPKAPPKEEAAPKTPSYKPASEFDEVIKKASGSHPRAAQAPSEEDAAGERESRPAGGSERIEIISEPVAEEAPGDRGMTYDEVVAAAEPRPADTGTEDKLAASGITFEDVGPAVPAIIEEAAEPGGQSEDSAEAASGATDATPVSRAAEIEGPTKEPLEIILGEPETEEVTMPAPIEPKTAPPGEEAGEPPKKKPARTRSAVTKFQKHVHPGKRHTALHPPQKKKPWLFILIIVFMALGGGGLIVFRQFFMPPKKTPSEIQKEEEEKKRYSELQDRVNSLVERSRKIAENPADYDSFTREASDLSVTALPDELKEKVKKAKDTASQQFESSSKAAVAKANSEYEKAIADRNLQAALKALEDFPAAFGGTEYATKEIPGLRAPVEKTLSLLEKYREKKVEALELERQGRFDEAAKLIEEISYHSEGVLSGYLKEVGEEAARLRELATKEKERLEEAARKLHEAFESAQTQAEKLAADEKFKEALDGLAEFRRNYPGSKHESDVMRLMEKIVDQKRRAEIRNFFNGKDLKGWTLSGEWKVEDSQIAGVAAAQKAWLLKGDASWSDYVFEFDFKRSKGSFFVCLRAASGEPESGFTLEFGERPFQRDTWYHVKCEVAGANVFITTSFNNQRWTYPAKRDRGIVGFILSPESEIHIKNVTMELP